MHMTQTMEGLKELNILSGRHVILFHTEHIVKIWYSASSLFCLTIIHCMQDSQERIVAQLAIRGGDCKFPNVKPPCGRQQAVDVSWDVEFLQWACDDISDQLSN